MNARNTDSGTNSVLMDPCRKNCIWAGDQPGARASATRLAPDGDVRELLSVGKAPSKQNSASNNNARHTDLAFMVCAFYTALFDRCNAGREKASQGGQPKPRRTFGGSGGSTPDDKKW